MTEILLSFPSIIICLVVCLAKIIEITIQAVKTVMMVKGQKVIAAVLGFIECLVWGVVVSSVISLLGSNYYLLISYCFGYASGLWLGSTLEEKIALGTSNVRMTIKPQYVDKVIEYLEAHNKGFTAVDGFGAKGPVIIVEIVLSRKEVKPVMRKVKSLCNNDVFEITSDVNHFKGGFGIKK